MTAHVSELRNAIDKFPRTERLPVLFLGHGSPMNALEENEFTRGWGRVGASLPTPTAVLCISAHWETNGTYVTAVERPRTIHDFFGFPPELFRVQYPAPGSPELAEAASQTLTHAGVELDRSWGLDHGCWSVAKHLYPAADIPIVQLSLDRRQSPRWHYDLARELSSFRRRGILILGSGNMVHNLSMMDWEQPEKGFDWAGAAHDTLKRLITGGDHDRIVRYETLGRELRLAVPTPEHFLPLLYALALKENDEEVGFFNDRTIFGSIAMTSLKIATGV